MKKNKVEKLVSSKRLNMFTLEQVAMRPNCLVILQKPSRMANILYYPNGRVEKTNGM
jgi:hypothetical protein